MAGARDIMAGRAFVTLSVRKKLFTQGLRAAQVTLSQFGSAAKMAGRRMIGVGIAAAAGFGVSIKRFADFEDAMAAVGAVTESFGTNKFREMTEVAKELGRTTSFTAVQVAESMTELGRAGFDPTQINAMISGVLSLARATKTDLAESAGIAASTLRQFNLEASDFNRVSDALVATANKSFNTLTDLGESLKFAGPVAADMNISLEDTLALLGALGNVGIKGSMAGTAIRRVALAAATESEKIFDTFGVQTLDAAGNVRPLIDIFDEIFKASERMGTGERSAALADIFGLRGITAVSALSRNAMGVRELADAIKAAGGIAEKTAKAMDDTLGGSFRRLLSAVEGIAIAFGEAVVGDFRKFIDWLVGASRNVVEFIKANQEFVKMLALAAPVTVALGVALMGIGTAATVAAGILGAAGGLVPIITFLIANPIVLPIAVGIAGVGIAASAAVVHMLLFSDVVENLIESLKLLKGDVGNLFEAMKIEDTTVKMELISEAFNIVWDEMLLQMKISFLVMMGELSESIFELAKLPQKIPGKLFKAPGDVFRFLAGEVGGEESDFSKEQTDLQRRKRALEQKIREQQKTEEIGEEIITEIPNEVITEIDEAVKLPFDPRAEVPLDLGPIRARPKIREEVAQLAKEDELLKKNVTDIFGTFSASALQFLGGPQQQRKKEEKEIAKNTRLQLFTTKRAEKMRAIAERRMEKLIKKGLVSFT